MKTRSRSARRGSALLSLLGVGALGAGAFAPACGGNGTGFAPGSDFTDAAAPSGGDASTPGMVDGPSLDPDAGKSSVDSGLQSCATGEAQASREAIYLLFVLDGSGSMSSNNKWSAATGAIDAIFSDMQTKADPGVGAGLIVFSDVNDPNILCFGGACAYPSAKDIPIGFVDAAQLASLNGRTASPDQPQSGTPTGKAITGGYAELSAFKPTGKLLPNGKKVLVLLTDGVPTDTCKPKSTNGSDDYTVNECVKMAATNLTTVGPAGPIETFVIGVGALPGDYRNYDSAFLGALAVAGGSAPKGCNPKENTPGAADFCYFNVDPTGSSTATQQAFEKAINDIRGQVSSCTLALNPTSAGTINPANVNVTLNGTPIPKDPANGWTYDDPAKPTSVTLHGSYCDTLKNDPNAKVSIVLGCVYKDPR